MPALLLESMLQHCTSQIPGTVTTAMQIIKAVQQFRKETFPQALLFYFPTASCHVKVWSEPMTSLLLIRMLASGTRVDNGSRKIVIKTVQNKRLPVVVMSWNLAWWLRTTYSTRKCMSKNMGYKKSDRRGTLMLKCTVWVFVVYLLY